MITNTASDGGGAGLRGPAAITVTGLRKSYGDHVVLDGIDLNIAEGFCLLPAGPQRSRQDHRGQDPVHADQPRCRPGDDRGP